MAIDPKIIHFGIKQIAPYDLKTGIPYGFADVIGSGGVELSGEVVTLQGGANRFPWQNAHGFIEPKVTVNIKEFPSFFYNIMLGATPTLLEAANGLVHGEENVTGTSAYGAAGSITSVDIKTAADLKFGRYLVVIVDNAGDGNDARGVNIYASGDIDAGLGSNELLLFDNFLRITENPIELTDGGKIDVPQLGIALTAAADVDASGLEVGDSFRFEIVPATEFAREVIIGLPNQSFLDFGMYMFAERGGGLSTMFIDCYKCKGNGFSHTLTEKAYSESEVTIMPVQDGRRGVCRFVDIKN